MASLNIPDIQGNTTAESADVNFIKNAIVDEFNGNIDAANLADSAVTAQKLAQDSVIAGKIADGAIALGNIQDGSVEASSLVSNYIVSENVSLGNIDNNRAKVTSVGISEGTWLIIARSRVQYSVAQDTSVTFYLENETDGVDLDEVTIQVDYPGSVIAANQSATLIDIFVADGNKTIAVDAVANTGAGTTNVKDTTIIALQVGI